MRKIDKEKENKAIEYLKSFEPEDDKYVVAYSGGKDSDVIRILAELSGVKYDLIHNLTTVDEPETMRYLHSIPNLQIHRRELNMQQLIIKNGFPPTRTRRYCCEYFKEKNEAEKGRIRVTGVRKEESKTRKKLYTGNVSITGKPKTTQRAAFDMGADYTINDRGGIVLNNDNDANKKLVEYCYRNTKVLINPILDWTEDDVWDFLNYYQCDGNPLYQQGWYRIGCIGCPLKKKKEKLRDFEIHPNFKKMYIRTFDKMIEARKEAGKSCDAYTTGEDLMERWLDW